MFEIANMNNDDFVYINGEIVRAKDAAISPFDRGFMLGDGIYEAAPVVNGKICDKADFWERFENSVAQIELKIPYTHEEYEAFLNEVIAKNGVKEGVVYTQITRGAAFRDFDYTDTKPTVFAYAFSKVIFDNPLGTKGIEIVSLPEIRWHRRDIKSISLLAQCISKHLAHKAGAFECFLVEDGLVTECSSSSAFIIKDGVLITRPLSHDILPGIRRKVILGFAGELGLKVEQRAFSMEEVYGADEVFISAASLMAIPVIKADGKPINGGKIGKFTPLIRERYAKHLKEEAGLL
ncbi:aminotransferase class IV [Campylobacter sp. JMF_01 NE2]|uniref:aminotransferase class IV n=1 Tax=unclassified Campylobacter TaxID=2593542 RepID=UPI0022E9E20F|nr:MULTISPECIES: aminotransferase class IV [unclassified Campylobacter]MDA3052691.1 aminotransferase class IV [Campylobacter sp. JMF_03 NE3]MDA3067022.1 aminotransferase class IV [Campylobacter sp. JMF_01 NE2]